MINKVTLIGRVGNDPEVKSLENGNKVSSMSVATNEGYKDKNGEWVDKTEWHSVTSWNALAEKSERLSKGTLIYVEGKLSTRKWQDKDGNDRYKTEVVANYFRIIVKNDSGVSQSASQPVGASEDDDLPF